MSVIRHAIGLMALIIGLFMYSLPAFGENDPLSQVKLVTNLSSPQPVYNGITLIATATGGGAVQYRFAARTLVENIMVWQELSAYSAVNTCLWQPATAGTYYLEVWAREQGSLMEYEVSSSQRFDIYYSSLAVTLTTDLPSPQPVASTITLQAATVGALAPTFQFWQGIIQDGTVNWTPLNEFSPTPILAWQPGETGSYRLKVFMREAHDPTSIAVSEEIPYIIRERESNEIGNALAITKFLDNKAAAVSFTFDDGLQSQLNVAVPLLDAFGFKATFGIIAGATPNIDGETPPYPFGSNITGSWAGWRAIATRGHEIANHSLTHVRLMTVSDPVQLDQEFNGSADLITEQIGTAPLTFVFPYNHYNDRLASLALQHHIAIRDDEIGYGNRLYTAGEMNAAVDNAIQHGEWMVPMLHGFAQGEYAFVDRWTFQAHLSYLAGQSAQVWVETYGGVSRYQQERDSAQMRISELDAHRLTFTLSTPMDPAIFNRPLTVLVATGGIAATTAQATVVETGQSLPTRVTPQGILVNVTPGSNRVRVQWQ